jgi:hypothetical protein
MRVLSGEPAHAGTGTPFEQASERGAVNRRVALIWRPSRASGFPSAGPDDLCGFDGEVIVGRVHRETHGMLGHGQWYWTMVVFTDRDPAARNGWEDDQETAQHRVEEAYAAVKPDR